MCIHFSDADVLSSLWVQSSYGKVGQQVVRVLPAIGGAALKKYPALSFYAAALWLRHLPHPEESSWATTRGHFVFV